MTTHSVTFRNDESDVLKGAFLRRTLSTGFFLMAFCSAGLLFVSAVRAADWTEFRGPTGQGHAGDADLPIRWSETEHVFWKVEVPGQGWSSPVTAGGRIYLTSAVPDNSETAGSADAGKDAAEKEKEKAADGEKAAEAPVSQSLRVLCLNADDGKQIWNQEVFVYKPEPDPQFHSKNSYASPTPILDGDRLYVHFGSYGTACLDLEGSVLWKNQELRYQPRHGNGGSPALAGEHLVICCDGQDDQFVVGIEKQTGKLSWKTERDTTPTSGFSFCTPTIIEAGGRQQAICPGSQAVFSYDPATGKEIWRAQYGQGFSVVPRPVFAHGLVFICSGFGDGQLLAIDPTGTGDITASHIRWSTKKSVPNSPSLLVVDDLLFSVSDAGVATCFDAKSGKIHWTHRLSGAFSASPTVAGGRIYFQNETGETTIVKAASEYEEIAVNQIGTEPTRTFASFAVIDQSILLRSEKHLYRIQN